MRFLLFSAVLVATCTTAFDLYAARVGDLTDVQGARDNMLKGVGMVVGLAGTGDATRASLEAQERIMQRLGIDVASVNDLSSSNAAMVMVTAVIPAYAKEGTRLDVKVDSIYDADSLEGGQLLETHLTGPGISDTVYAVAQGAVSVGGFNAGGGGGTGVRQNHVTAGRIPMGAFVEREVPSTITDGERIMLLLKRPDFGLANNVKDVINRRFNGPYAMALGAGTVRVTIPTEEQNDLVSFIAGIQSLEVATTTSAKVVINERTGTIVVGGDVMIKPCQVAHGDLTIEVAVTPEVTPALPFTDANPVVTETVDLNVEEEEAYFMPVEGTSAGEVAQALNRLRVTPRDMISIFQALREAGALEADLEIM